MGSLSFRKIASASGCLLAFAFISSASGQADTPAGYAHLDDSASNPQPPYPDSAQINGEQGTITLKVHVRSSGRADKVRVLETSGYADLDMAAEQGVLNWHYVPATRSWFSAQWTVVKVVYQLPRYVPASTNSQSPNP